ncbi:putative dUTPase [Dickeya phage vB_DsoM_JA29]|uniref:dUTP diphosphatase n=1 Tax=Dickeya phage vB_DsoM_JA29 TaxID=2283031 RepID=A0A384ZXM8_9CAUD|nr:putative dUTPase [Dickeya phage vB_DsoM_JA29]AXG67008.1 putative dUTPase [Dickeya phage vB_DsoM_JA29]
MTQIFTPVSSQILFNILPDEKYKANFIPPSYGTPFSAALDVIAQEDFYITHETQLIPLGFSAEFPEGTACLLLPRSGFGAKFGVALANTLGLIDPDYRGPWMAATWLNGGGTKVSQTQFPIMEEFEQNGQTYSRDTGNVGRRLHIPRGEAFAQLLFVKTERPLPNIVSELSETVRGEGGFGSTNKIAK